MTLLSFLGWSQLPDGETDKAVGAAAYNGNIHIFGVGREGEGQGKIYEKIKRGDVWSEGWPEIQGNGLTNAGLAAVAFGGNLYLFSKRINDGQMYFNFKSGTDSAWQARWTLIPGLVSDAAPAAAVYQNKIHLFAKRSDGNEVFTCRFPEAGTFSAWGEVAGGGRVKTGLGVMTYEDAVWSEGGSFSLFLFGVGLDTKIYINKWSPLDDCWSGWSLLPFGGTTDSPVTGARVTRPGVGTTFYRYMAVFSKGVDDRAGYWNERGTDEPDWAGFHSMGGRLRSAITPVVLNNRIHLYGVGDNFGIWENLQRPF